MKQKTYRILRFYSRAFMQPETIETGLTLEEAKAHCRDPETSSRTCTTPEACKRTRAYGDWFDGYEEEQGG